MNQTFKILWSFARGSHIVSSEISRSRRKPAKTVLATAVIAGLAATNVSAQSWGNNKDPNTGLVTINGLTQGVIQVTSPFDGNVTVLGDETGTISAEATVGDSSLFIARSEQVSNNYPSLTLVADTILGKSSATVASAQDGRVSFGTSDQYSKLIRLESTYTANTANATDLYSVLYNRQLFADANVSLDLYAENVELLTDENAMSGAQGWYGNAISGNGQGSINIHATDKVVIRGAIESLNSYEQKNGTTGIHVNINQGENDTATVDLIGQFINAADKSEVNIKGAAGSSIKVDYLLASASDTTSGGVIRLAFGNESVVTANNISAKQGGLIEISGNGDSPISLDASLSIGEKSETEGLGGHIVLKNLSIANQNSDSGDDVVFIGGAYSDLKLENVTFENNTVSGANAGDGAIYSYGVIEHEGGAYINNSVLNTAENGEAYGGAIMLKGSDGSLFKDVAFQNNSVTSNGVAFGGALFVDYSTGEHTNVDRPSEVTFEATKDLIYSGNKVSAISSERNVDTYGYHSPHTQAGGFLFLDRGSEATFDVAGDATLTIGSAVTDDDTDSIASSIPNTGSTVNNGKHALITKDGAGNLVLNSSLNKYYGEVDVRSGTMTVNSRWEIKNEVSVGSGATLALADFELIDSQHSGNQDASGNAIGGKLSVASGGTLETNSSIAFQNAAGESVTDSGSLTENMDKVEFSDGASLALNDANYTLDYVLSANDAIAGKGVDLIMLGNLAGTENNTVTLDEISNISGNTVLNSVTVDAENKNLQIGGTNPGADVAYRADSLSVAAIDLGTADTITVDGGKELTLVGNGSELVSSESESETSLIVKNGATLTLGGVYAQGGTLNAEVDLDAGTQMQVIGNADFTVDAIVGTGKVTVGDETSAGNLTINSIDGFTGMIFVDPAWVDGVAQVGDASQVSIGIDSSVGADIVAGQNSIISMGTAADIAVSAFEKIAAASNLKWKDDVTAAVYIDAPIILSDTADQSGSIIIDGSLTSAPSEGGAAGSVQVKHQGMLIANQAATSEDTALIGGTVSFDEGSYLGLVNSAEGTFKLANTITGSGLSVVTDNPFIVFDHIDTANGTVTTKTDADNGLKSIASIGLQAMTRRADSVLAGAIADRTSISQKLKEGLNLWVDVVGETYEADHFDRGGSFKADMGYGTFGGDVATGDFTFGGAFQYGTGTLRSSVNGIKNSIDNYGVSLYGTYKLTEALKLGAELAYVWGENDIAADQTALNQSVDTEMYSFGLRAMYQVKAGLFSFEPSIGLRLSQLSTDEMKVGTIKIEDQDQTLVQMPIALRITASDFTAGGWVLAPNFKIAYVPTFGEKDIAILHTSEDVIDTSPVQTEFGLIAGKDNMLFNVNFMLGAGEYGSSAVGGKIGFKYAF